MSFASPVLLWGLLLVPAALLAYLLVQRRRIKYAARFTNLDLPRTSSTPRPVVGGTCRRFWRSPRWPHSSSPLRGPRPSWPCRAKRLSFSQWTAPLR